jgi:hypothetical protein
MSESPVVSIGEHFSSLKDPRVGRTKLHQLLDIIVIMVRSRTDVLFGQSG